MAQIPYNLSPETLTFVVKGKPETIFRSHPKFNEVLSAVIAGDADLAVELSKPAVAVAAKIEEAVADSTSASAKWFRRAASRVEVTEWGVTVDGNAIHGVVVDRLLAILREGLDVSSWVRFITKLYQNPSSSARNELYEWMESGSMPITEDGDFLAYKRVRGDYKDIHSGRFNNSVGQVVSMNRLDVDDDRTRTCSAGLHFCSYAYLPNFGNGTNQGTDKIVVVKINPADVVAIPVDYQFTKGRTWRYEVVDEISLADAGIKVWDAVVSGYGDGEYNEDWDEYEDDEEDEYGDQTASRTLIGNVFAAYAKRYPDAGPTKAGAARDLRLLRAEMLLDVTVDSFGDLTADEAQALIDAWS